jgi:hypothetical protein
MRHTRIARNSWIFPYFASTERRIAYTSAIEESALGRIIIEWLDKLWEFSLGDDDEDSAVVEVAVEYSLRAAFLRIHARVCAWSMSVSSWESKFEVNAVLETELGTWPPTTMYLGLFLVRTRLSWFYPKFQELVYNSLSRSWLYQTRSLCRETIF